MEGWKAWKGSWGLGECLLCGHTLLFALVIRTERPLGKSTGRGRKVSERDGEGEPPVTGVCKGESSA